MVELLMAMGIVGTLTLILVAFTSTSMRLVGRNLATNHSHDNIRVSAQRMLADFHESASPFELVNFDGTTYSEITEVASSDTDAMTQRLISARANGVRYYETAGGPYRLNAPLTATSTTLEFDFGPAPAGGAALPYVPQAGDRFVIPLIGNRSLEISSVPTAPTAGNTIGRVTIAGSGIGFRFRTEAEGGATFVTTAYFYRKCAYTVYNGELRYHPNFEGSNRNTFVVVRGDITSPQPFAVLFNGATKDRLNLRISLEAADKNYSARMFKASTTTLQAVVPPRNNPPPLNDTN